MAIFAFQPKHFIMNRKATAVWKGSGKEGKGVVSTQSPTLNQTQYSFKSRFEERTGTNPEELIAAAHAGCFSMKLSFILGEAGFTPDEITTDCTVSIDNGTITKSALVLKAKVPGISKDKFQSCAEEAKKTCPVSKALSINVTLESSLI
jgi:lipoyl-dependent peroxiredoxin